MLPFLAPQFGRRSVQELASLTGSRLVVSGRTAAAAMAARALAEAGTVPF